MRATLSPTEALAYLFQLSQSRLNEQHPNCVLRVKRARARLRLPRIDTLILPHPAHTSLYPPALAHQVLSRAALCCIGSCDSAGLYSEGACYNVMIEALDSGLSM